MELDHIQVEGHEIVLWQKNCARWKPGAVAY
jgi:hypothetical protein